MALPAGNFPLTARSWKPHERAAYLNFGRESEAGDVSAPTPSSPSKLNPVATKRVNLAPYHEDEELSPYGARVLQHVNDARAAAIADAVRPSGGVGGSIASSNTSGFGGGQLSEWDDEGSAHGLDTPHFQAQGEGKSNRIPGVIGGGHHASQAGGDQTINAVPRERPQSANDALMSSGDELNMRPRSVVCCCFYC